MMLIGFDTVKSNLIQSYQNQKLHHAILLCGKKGIGKASFAKKFVLEILNTENSSHPDLLIIEKEAEKKEIGIEKIRNISGFLNQTAAIALHKFIIIDSACELNKSASNALLKILEEPHANNFLILITHNPNRILPTIRSRCQITKIPSLTAEDFTQIIDKTSSETTEFLTEICDGSISDAINLGPDLSRFYQLFLRSILNQKLGDELLKQISDKNFSFAIAEKIIEFFFNRLIKVANNAQINFFFDEQKVFLDLLKNLAPQKTFAIADESLSVLHKAQKLYLDKKLCVINIFNRICHE
ncbi:MAG: hypothetical protein A2887_04085 [Alphaproteobacteria bacterium RIFCSPLOWO2_01_FULL_40_26]|nr:MAG: hypothetical protein A3D15_01870 [Alphaproteobacteria bacterium RIFCSPHIGHO2_02_FULL_40_34]OFW93916.1 MAG: hypothetical protein A2887_04085 [Alphaproteobacteria bacterium RIFCSPLOWO2_01_FULL_40_26]OFX09410.1 MAG: hypothetical protein A3H30_01700 [Alphaproteobacteria bacterium RIFCSPLOWO2_02_FULL_40_19]OFX11973.1 MAG: hypothetical protein A3G22_05315 [Alphaproteobacteria bacterium RIFCSPLOWO2_12_FULL_40_11]